MRLEVILIPEVREDASQSALAKHIHNNTFLGPLFESSPGVVIRVEYETGGLKVRTLTTQQEAMGPQSVTYFYPWLIIQRVKEIS